ncbi:MAG TPA: glycoside hydrolase family 43 protein [Telluria sp.]
MNKQLLGIYRDARRAGRHAEDRHHRPMSTIANIAAALLLAACSGGGSAPPAPTVPPAPSASAPAPSSLGDFPDPFVLADGGQYYAYATNGQGKNVQLLRSPDLRTWTAQPDVMPVLASWVRPANSMVWAPEVIKIGEKYVLYYTARDRGLDRQCVGAAVASAPGGPYRDTSAGPLVCQVAEGGTIDAAPLASGGKLYLYFKSDGNCCRLQTHLYAQELRADGLALLGSPRILLSNERGWEGGVVEAPTMVERDGRFYLFYSANDYAGAAYAVGYASCAGPLGPCTPAPENPILKSRAGVPRLTGPGHQAIFEAGGKSYIAYHAWEELAGGARGDRRFMYLDELAWVEGKPVVRTTSMLP